MCVAAVTVAVDNYAYDTQNIIPKLEVTLGDVNMATLFMTLFDMIIACKHFPTCLSKLELSETKWIPNKYTTRHITLRLIQGILKT